MLWMFSVSLFLWLVFQGYFSEGLGGGGNSQSCQYEILGLDASITVNATVDIGTTLYNLKVEHVSPGRRRKRRRGSPTSDEFDIILNTNSQYFEMNFVNGHHEVVVKSCLEDGHTEALHFSINETLDDDGSCDESTLSINVVQSFLSPSFTVPSAVNLSVDTCVQTITLDVVELQFDNGGNCSSWYCSVNSTNDVKLFWVGTGNTVQTFLNDTNFNFTYKLLVTCLPNDTPEVTESSKERNRGERSRAETLSEDNPLDVIFIDPGPCTNTGFSVTTSLLNLTHQDSLSGYLDDPANVALVSSLGGVTAGAAAGAGLSILAARYCRTKRITAVAE